MYGKFFIYSVFPKYIDLKKIYKEALESSGINSGIPKKNDNTENAQDKN